MNFFLFLSIDVVNKLKDQIDVIIDILGIKLYLVPNILISKTIRPAIHF